MSQVHVVLNLYERRDFSEKNVHTGVITELTVFLYKNCDFHKKGTVTFLYKCTQFKSILPFGWFTIKVKSGNASK